MLGVALADADHLQRLTLQINDRVVILARDDRIIGNLAGEGGVPVGGQARVGRSWSVTQAVTDGRSATLTSRRRMMSKLGGEQPSWW